MVRDSEGGGIGHASRDLGYKVCYAAIAEKMLGLRFVILMCRLRVVVPIATVLQL